GGDRRRSGNRRPPTAVASHGSLVRRTGGFHRVNQPGRSLSVVIPSRARPDLLRCCLASVTEFAAAETEIIVGDDASPGEKVSRAAADFTGVRTVRLPRRRGFCAAVNAGIRTARGAVVELLNDDTEVTAGWADAALRVFDDPRVAAVAPLVLCRPEYTGQP